MSSVLQIIFSFLKKNWKIVLLISLVAYGLLATRSCVMQQKESTRKGNNFNISQQTVEKAKDLYGNTMLKTQEYVLSNKELKSDNSKLASLVSDALTQARIARRNFLLLAQTTGNATVSITQHDTVYIFGDQILQDTNSTPALSSYSYRDSDIYFQRICKSVNNCITNIQLPFKITVIENRFKPSKIFFIRWFQKWQYQWTGITSNKYMKLDGITVIRKKD
jgi:hypothetical protein